MRAIAGESRDADPVSVIRTYPSSSTSTFAGLGRGADAVGMGGCQAAASTADVDHFLQQPPGAPRRSPGFTVDELHRIEDPVLRFAASKMRTPPGGYLPRQRVAEDAFTRLAAGGVDQLNATAVCGFVARRPSPLTAADPVDHPMPVREHIAGETDSV
jgi:hypothetical protein